jgi:flagellar protein FlaG
MSELNSVTNVPNIQATEGVGTFRKVKARPGNEAKQTQASAAAALSSEALESAAGDANVAAQSLGNRVRFEVSDEYDQLLVKVVDRDTGVVVRTIPPERLLEVQSKIGEMVGLIFDEER